MMTPKERMVLMMICGIVLRREANMCQSNGEKEIRHINKLRELCLEAVEELEPEMADWIDSFDTPPGPA